MFRLGFLVLIAAAASAGIFWSPSQNVDVSLDWVTPMDPMPVKRPPLILVPPMGGTEVYGMLHDAKVPHVTCPRNTDWELIWYPTRWELLRPDCWVGELRMVYNATTDTYGSEEGCQTKLNTTLAAQTGKLTGAYSAIAPLLQQKFGYIPEHDLLTFVYDWRMGPHQWAMPGGFYDNMKTFFEETYAAHNNTPIVALSMSLGGPWFAEFLMSYVDQAWKDKYMAAFFSLSGPYAGAAIATMNQIALSDGWSDHHVPLIFKQALMDLSRSVGSVTWMAPPAQYWNDTVFFETTAGKTYTASQFGELFRDAKCDTTALMWEKASQTTTLAPIGVRGYFYYGYNVSTPQKYTYPPDFSGENPVHIDYVSGDGVASLQSLGDVPARWATMQTQEINLRPFFNCTHDNTLFRADVLASIVFDLGALINSSSFAF